MRPVGALLEQELDVRAAHEELAVAGDGHLRQPLEDRLDGGVLDAELLAEPPSAHQRSRWSAGSVGSGAGSGWSPHPASKAGWSAWPAPPNDGCRLALGGLG